MGQTTSIINQSITLTNENLQLAVWPIKIQGGTEQSPIVITFGEDLNFNSTENYFIIETEHVMIEGSNKTVLIDSVNEYIGLFQNGTNGNNGYLNVTIQNVNMSSLNSTLSTTGGWLSQAYYGFGLAGPSANRLKITNCHVDETCASGNINNGLVCGQFTNYTACRYCTSKGEISGGGIFGSNCTNCGAVECFSTGEIGSRASSAGGIYAKECDSTNVAIRCYSIGGIYQGCGGICGESNVVRVFNSYSLGQINLSNGSSQSAIAGGIYGTNSTGIVSNSYSAGIILTGGEGIGGDVMGQINCYVANGNWSDSTALSLLDASTAPVYVNEKLINPVGSIYTDIDRTNNNTPWIFSNFGYSPYTTELVDTFEQSINSGQSTIAALDTIGHTFSIVAINNSYDLIGKISINQSNGKITTSSNLASGIYTIKILKQSDYVMTNFILNLTFVPPNPDSSKLPLYQKYCKINLFDHNNSGIYSNEISSISTNAYCFDTIYSVVVKPKYGTVKLCGNKYIYTPYNNNKNIEDRFALQINGLIPITFIVYKIKIH